VKRLLVLGLFFAFAVPASAGRLPIVASQDWWPVWSPNGQDVAFTRISGRTMTLEVVDLAAHRTVRIAANQGQLSPSWSSDGRLAFSLGGRVYTANADGTSRSRISGAGHSYAPAWRPESGDIAYLTTAGARNTDLWVSGALWARDAIGKPAWSPDGSRLAFQREDGIYVTTGPAGERKVAAAVTSPGVPAWSPDGTTIAYRVASRIWLVAADGSSSPRALTAPMPGVVSDPGWSREGDSVTFTAQAGAWIAYLDTGHAVELIRGGGVGAAFSPTGDVVAFSGARPACPSHAAIRVYYDNEFNGPVTGTCEIRGTAGSDVIDGTVAGGDVILAGKGNDTVHARNGHHDIVECGPGRDAVWADRNDTLRGCEIVHVG
jgi:dipeptidyl aminopeptidase/acylaminoacyl peptidase